MMDNKHSNIPQGYKYSSLGIIPKDWDVKRLGELGSFLKGKGVPKDKITTSGYKCLTYGDIYTKYDIVLNNIRSFIDEETAIISEELRAGDILFAGSGETLEDIGKAVVYLDNDKVYAGGDIIILRQNKVNSLFLSYLLNSSKSNYQKYQIGQGHSVVHIYSSQLANLLISVPPLSEQQKIAEILSVWDKSIDIQTRLIASLQTRKRALMQQLLTGEKRISGFRTPWQTVKLRDVCHRVTRKNSDDNKNVVTISAQKGFVIQTDFFNKSIASEVIDNYYLVCKDEFCYNKSYSNGYPMGAIKRLKNFDKAVVTTLYICFKINNTEQTNINFFEQYCETGLLNNGLMKVANEGGRAHGLLNVTPDDFFNLKLSLPLFAEQTAIADRLTIADREINLAKQKLSYLRTQKRGLMQQLLTGKKRVEA